MKNKIVLFSVLAVFAVIAVIAVPSVSATYPANAIYLNPEDSSGLYCENNTLVEVRVNASVVTTSVQTDIYFDPSCVNITDVDFTGSAWPPLAPPGWTHWGDHVTLIGIDMAEVPAGDNLFATIRLHCVNEDYCMSDLAFSGVIVSDSAFIPISITPSDGTFTCEAEPIPSIEVNKTVFDPETEEWVEEIEANKGDIVRFKCEIHNDGTCPLEGIVARDILSDSLQYADTATVDGQDWEPIIVTPNEFKWDFGGRVLVHCETITIEFDTLVIGEGYDCNVQNATAICLDTGDEVYDEDTACVDVLPYEPSIEVNKTVFDPETEEWVEEIEANKGDIVRFKCEIHNDGTCPLEGIVARDILSDSLQYADTATVDGQDWEPIIVTPNEFKWDFGGRVLVHCETITIEFDTLVIGEGYDCNVQNATAICLDTGDEVYDEDTACVDVLPYEPSIEVNKTVFDPETEEWVEEIEANKGDIVRFKCEIHNDGTCPLTGIVARDILSDSLQYADTATVDGQDWEPIIVTPNEFKWDFGGRVLVHCETITIEFDTLVIGEGYDCNVQNATAICLDTGDEVYDEDTACVDVLPYEPSIEVNKTVFDPETEEWVEEIEANKGDIVRFKCEIHNDGTCPLEGIVARDILSDSLQYADTATVDGQDWEPIIVTPNEFKWDFGGRVLVHCETITIEFDTLVIGEGYDCNVQNATAICLDTGDEVYDEDTACVDVLPYEPSIEVNKTVFDPETEEWVEEIEANKGDIVRFKCEIHNDGTCPLTGIVARDILSDSLQYADTATVDGQDWEPIIVTPNEFKWDFGGRVLVHCETITIEFDTLVIGEGYDCNVQNATAICLDTGDEVYDEDTACVDVLPYEPSIEVNKTVFDPETEEWVEEIEANKGDIVRFKCEIHNDGTCPLTGIVARDILSDSLQYADTATVDGQDWEPIIVTPNEFKWDFGGRVLVHCETITIEFDTLVIGEGYDCNVQNATAICLDTGDEVYDEDTACVDVLPYEPSIEVNKTVFDPETEEWVEEIEANKGDIVRFKCEIHNDGTCPLEGIVARDILSDSLQYADTATVDGQDWEPIIVTPNEFKWDFGGRVLVHCETITIEFDTLVIGEGYDCNVQNATAICLDTGDEVYDEDTACVDVPERPDLTVTEITVNYDAPDLGGRAIGPVPGDDVYTECNNLSAVIAEENGVDIGSPFDVTFKVDGTTLCTVYLPSLTGGANKTVYCNCSWYPYAGDAFAINVTVDSKHEIPESNETNNTKWNNGTVISNGYKGDGWQGPDKNLINVQCHEQDTINLTYSVGDSEYVSGYAYWTEYTANWTTSDLPVPDGAEIEKAMLYVYYTWDKNNVMPDNVTMVFNGNNIALARNYSDRKGFGSSNYPSGMLVYNVLNNFAATGTNNASLTKAVAADVVSMRGMLLMVVYKHPDEPERMICIDEGYDMLYAKDSYAVTSEEATTYAPFTCCEQVPVDELGKATLIAIAPSASDGDDMNRLSFNDGLWQGIWDHYEANTQLGIAEANVLAYLKPADNRANFQSHIPAGGDKGDFMDASNAFLILEKKAVAKPDLNVTGITVNYDAPDLGGRAIGPVPGDDVYTECNNLSAVIAEENGVDIGSPFDVTFKVDGTTLCTVQVPGLTGGANKTVYCNCSWYPYAGDAFAINVTVDSKHEIPESNETNNTKWNNGTVISNGYKGDGWQGPDKNLINVQCHEQDTINLTYSVGDSEYVSGYAYWTEYTANWTTSDLPVPDGAEIEKAMLYVYYTWDKNNVMPDNVTMVFNGNNIALARNYSDRKGFGSSNYPSGMLVYNVLNNFAATGTNNASLTKAVAADVVSMRGMLLMVVYKHPDEPERMICIDEGYDMLYAKDSYAVTSEEATTYAPFTCCEQVPVDELGKATLIAIAPSASDGDDMNRLSFNDGLWQGIWDHYEANTQLGIAEANVLAYLKPADNRANFQSHIPAGGDKGDFMDASNAFLILEKKAVAKPDLNVTGITVNYDAPDLGGRAIGPVPGDDVYTECNNLSAVIAEENGVDVGSPFDVTFKVDGTTLCTVQVPGLTGGANKTVYCNCSWYPYAGDVFAINVTVDSKHEIPESNETNNTKWNNGTAVSNGYKGDGWQGPDKNLINVQCHEQDTINLTYSVGDSEYVSGYAYWTEYTANWTTSDLPVPDGAEIEKAMLYVYYTWDKNNVMPDNVTMVFNGNNIALARNYSDRKGFGSSNYPSGMLVYNVLNNFAATGTNNASLTKAVAADVVSMRGMLLMVVYKHPDEPERMICIDEGYDMLYAKDSYAVTSEEATTYAPFTCCEQVPVDELGKATLIAIAPSASDGDDMNRLSFNDGLWQGIWDHYEANTQLGIAEANVLAYLKPADNRANFQSHIPAGGDKGDFMDASNAFLILEKKAVAKPDLNVTGITVNYDAPDLGGRAIGPVPGDDVYTECNNLSAVIAEENGVDVGSPFDVTFKVDGTTLCTVQVPGLTGGANKTVYCNCSWYPYAGDVFAINVTVDSKHEIPESNETNNTKWNNGTAVSNGYKGDGWQGPDKNLINVQCHEQDTINLTYSVGDSEYVSGYAYWTEYTANWTTDNLSVPDGANIEKAMLYVYYTWDKNNVMPDNVTMVFNGNNIALARNYSDRKGFGSSNYPSGMLVYNVLNNFAATGTNNASLTKAVAADVVSMRGMLLMVVYKHPDEPERMICIDEGYDMLYAKDSYAVTSEEATTYAPFTCCEQVPVDELGKATLIAIAPSASDGDDMNRLSFNDGLWQGIWDHYEANTQLGIAEANVLAYLKPADNRANFQSHIPAGGDKGDFMDASNAFLILEKEVPCPAKYAVYQANVRDPEEPLNKLRALRDNKLEDTWVTRYYEHSPMLTMVLSRADSDLVKDGAQLVSKYSIPVGHHVQGMDVNERITKQDVEEALSFTDRLKSEVMKNRDAIGVKSTEEIIVFIDEFEGQVKASEGKTFSAALKSSIYYESGLLRVDQQIVKE